MSGKEIKAVRNEFSVIQKTIQNLQVHHLKVSVPNIQDLVTVL